MSDVKSVLKELQLPKRLQDKIVQEVVYIENCIINWSANSITPFKGVNKAIPSITHFYMFRYRYYIYISDTILHYTIDNYRWKGIMIGIVGLINK